MATEPGQPSLGQLRLAYQQAIAASNAAGSAVLAGCEILRQYEALMEVGSISLECVASVVREFTRRADGSECRCGAFATCPSEAASRLTRPVAARLGKEAASAH